MRPAGEFVTNSTQSTAEPLLVVEDLKTVFVTSQGEGRAVDGVSFQLQAGETLGLVGESGCGKTVTALSLLRLVPDPPGKIVGGAIHFNGVNLLALTEEEMRAVRGNDISMVFQEPMTSLNPVFTIGDQITEAIILHQALSKREARVQAVEMLQCVGIPDPDKRVDEYPHQLSGGMRQRAMIAMALTCRPKLLIADEPTTALDVTIQAQILDLMRTLQADLGMAILLITHDLGVVADIADRVAVMYAGKIIEEAPVERLFAEPKHPYTQGLLHSVPRIDKDATGQRERLQEIPGLIPSIFAIPPGCAFAPRCPHVMERCRKDEPPLEAVGRETLAACWLHQE
ncbi:MAG: ABC transporter ATP-binding protein [Nitrospinae bacterium]|nr:ABC transporter ATP-binding protein [Nitrospinota bacterium]